MTEGERKRLGALRATLLVVGGVLASVAVTGFMVIQTLQEPWSEGPVTMDADARVSFWAGAVVLCGIQVAVLVVSWKFQSAPVGAVGVLALAAALAMTWGLFSPFYERPAPAWDGPGDDYVPCYSGSGDCPGG